jgi:NADH-quinone oxidoreductase subunit J
MALSFTILALLAVLGGIGVVAFRNPIHCALSMIVNMVALAGFYALLEAHFLATVQIIVYAGAIIVLVVFVIMLLNVKEESSQGRGMLLTTSASIFGIVFLVFLGRLINESFGGIPLPTNLVEGSVENIGKILYTKYVFTFEVAGALLLTAIVGATMLAKRERLVKKGVA